MNDIEKIVESVLPLCPKGGIDRIHLAQALTEKKLVVPMSKEQIEQAMYDIPGEYMDDFCEEHIKDIAQAIYEAQFKEIK